VSVFNLINKHAHHWRRLTCTDHNAVTYNVMTGDGATVYVYVTKYAAIRCKRQVWAYPLWRYGDEAGIN